MLDGGWVILPRDILNFSWADDCGTMWAYVYMVLRANINDSEWHGVTVKRGSFVASYDSLSQQTGLSVQQLRTIVSRLESTGKITRSKHSKFTLFTVIGYDEMQQPTGIVTANQQATNKVSTGNQQRNKQEEVRKTNLSSKCFDESDTDLSGKAEDSYIREIPLDEAVEYVYNAYPRKRGKAKGMDYIRAYLKAGRNIVGVGKVRFNHEELYCAVRCYAIDCERESKEEQYIQLFSTFANKTILDYVETARCNGFEDFMKGRYGDDWQNIRFKYV